MSCRRVRLLAAATLVPLLIPTAVTLADSAQAAGSGRGDSARISRAPGVGGRVPAPGAGVGPASAARPAPATPAAPPRAVRAAVFTSRVTANSTRIRDGAGHVWEPMPATFGTRNQSRRLLGVDIARTNEDALYRVSAWGVRGHQLFVPGPGTYTVTLKMVEDAFSTSGQRVFDVVAEGRTVAAGVDIAKAVGKNAAHDVRFTTRVTDGRLDVEFRKRVDLPTVSAVEVTSVGKVPVPTEAAPVVKLAPGNPFTTNIRNAPLAPNSAAVAAHVAKQVSSHWGGVAATNAYRYNIAFHTAARGTKRITVGFHDCQKKRYTPAGLFDGAKHFVDVPVPAAAAPATGKDGEMTIYDPATDRLWEFWQMRKSARGGWEACWGGRIDKASQNMGIFPNPFGTSASGLALAPSMVTIDEIRRGRIDHAIQLVVIDAAKWSRFSWPANRSDGFSNDPHAPMEGQRLRLDPRLDLNAYHLSPFARIVAEAAQEYGFVVTDKGGAVAVVTESGQAEKARTGTDPWHVLLGGPDYDALRGFPWDKLQALPKDYGKP